MKPQNIIALLFILLITSHCIKAQNTSPIRSLGSDSISSHYKKNDTFWKHTIAPGVFIGLAGATWKADTDVRAIRNRYTPNFRSKLDNYTQYAPGAVALGLKLSGVKGRNKLGRSIINWGGGMLIMGALVNGIKHTAKVMRPDGTTRNSFPSGHTATAFMNAAFLHKEYGHMSSMYSILGYSMSTYTGISRSLNNRHWLSDILAGAGIGILSTELSYLIIDSFYKNKGDFFTSFDGKYEIEKPSFVSIRMGQSFHIDMNSFEALGIEAGIEGAYFFNKHWGVGGELGFNHIPYGKETLDFLADEDFPKEITHKEIDIQSLGFSTLMVGGYYAKFLGKKFILQGKILTGLGRGTGGSIDIRGNRVESGNEEVNVPFLEYTVKNTWTIGSGISITGLIAPTLGISLYIDYKYANPKSEIRVSSQYPELGELFVDKERLPLNTLSGGLKLVSYF